MAVAANDADAVAFTNFKGLVVQYFALQAVKGLRARLDGKHIHAPFIGRFKGQNEWFTFLRHASLEGFEFLLKAFDHLVLGRDGFVVFVGPLHLLHGTHGGLDFLLGVGDGVVQRRFTGFFLDQELAVIALPRPCTEVVNFHNAVAHLVEEVAVVGDDKLGALEVLEKIFEPFGRVDVEVVGRLVKEDDINAAEAHQLTRQRQLGLLASREVLDRHVHGVLVQSKAFKNTFGDTGHIAAAA